MRMNSAKDSAAEALGSPRRLAPPEAPGAKSPGASGTRDQAHVAALLQAIAAEISQSDQRQSHALADLRARLDLMTERQTEPEVPEADKRTAPAETARKSELAARKPVFAIEDMRSTPAEPAVRPAVRAQQKSGPVIALPDASRQLPPAASLESVYAAVAKTYSDAAGLRNSVQLAAPTLSAPAFEPEADEGSDEFMDLSALAEQHLQPAAKTPLAQPAAPAVAASLAVEKSISDLARRVAQTEMKVGAATGRQSDGEAVAAVNAHIDALRAELEKLSAEHEKISVEVGQVSANVKSISEVAGRIGPIGDTVEQLNNAIIALRADLPGFAESAAERASSQVAASLTNGAGNTELAEKLAIVQSLLLAQSREHQEADGRSFGALESIRGLVENLHNRIDALETEEPEPLAPVPPAARFASPAHVEPVFAPGSHLEDAAAAAHSTAEVSPRSMSREELIASARRAALAASQKPRLAEMEAPSAIAPDQRGHSAAQLDAPKPNRLGSRAIISVAMVALLAAGLGMVFAKVMHKPAPAVTIEQTALPEMPDDPTDLPMQGKAKIAASGGKDASKPATDLSKTAPLSAADPAKTSAITPDEQGGMTAANAGELPQPVSSKPMVSADLGQAVTSADALPAAIAPLSVRNAALSGDAASAYLVADRFISGKDVPRDAIKARHWYEQAAKTGYPLAEFRLGLLFEKGDEGLSADRAQALAWYRKGAEHGNLQAMFNLASLYANQTAGSPDYASAAKWFERAASFGMKDSQFNLAVLYQSGLGVPKDAATAYKWFAIGAAQGDAEAAKQRDDVRKTMTTAAVAGVEAQIKIWHPKVQDHRANAGELPGAVASATQTAPASQSGLATAEAEVSDVQNMLVKLGYDPGSLDGTMSAQTREAIKTFEQRSGLPVNGEISDELVGKLKALAG